MIPTRFVVLPKSERLNSGKNKKEIAFRRVRIAEIVVIVLYFIESIQIKESDKYLMKLSHYRYHTLQLYCCLIGFKKKHPEFR